MKPKVLLDSGAYTAFRKGKMIDLDEYAKFVKKYKDEYAGCFTLDSIGNAKVSYDNWKYLQSLGVETIPIYHVGTSEEYLIKYLKETDYIGLGAIANLDATQRKTGLSYIWKKYLVDKDGYPKVKVHGLGLTDIDIMVRYPWYSVDSFTPVISAVWGSILLPKISHNRRPHYFGLSVNKVSDQGEHKAKMINSFFNLPHINREVLNGMFEEYGFVLGEIAYQKKNDRRGKKGEQARKPVPMWDLVKPSDPNIKTLANSWEERMRWNLVMWAQLRERLPIYPRPFIDNDNEWKEKLNDSPKTIMYMGVSTITHIIIFGKVLPKSDILISYAYMSDGLHKMINDYVR